MTPLGLRCPACRSVRSAVIDSRPLENARVRVRRCAVCRTQWPTEERSLRPPAARLVQRVGRKK